jgi:hypothetical protein
VYDVGYRPEGASTTKVCAFQTTDLWTSQEAGGERRLHFTVSNVGGIACSATVLLTQAPGIAFGPTGSFAPGASWVFGWNNPSPDMTYNVVLSPNGAGCQYRVTRQWYQRAPAAGLGVRLLQRQQLHRPLPGVQLGGMTPGAAVAQLISDS